LQESSTYAGRSLWEAILEFIQQRGTVLQTDVQVRFRNDDHATVRGVLNDLVDSGLVFRTGRGTRTTLRAASPEEVQLPEKDDHGEGLANLLWVAVNRIGPATRQELEELVPAGVDDIEAALTRLVSEGKVTRTESGDVRRYSCDGCLILPGASHGWEAAVFDHFQAIVTAIGTKLLYAKRADLRDVVGGSTYNFWIWDDHPMHTEVTGFLGRVREQAVDLRQRLDAYNNQNAPAKHTMTRVIAYVGQTLLQPTPDESAGDPLHSDRE
jgi:hypothetical protein